MSYLSDTLTIGVLLILLFGSISLYLYTRIQQAEQKIHLLESILLDLKMSAEIKSYTELPADDSHETPAFPSTTVNDDYVALDDVESPITEYTSLDDSVEPVTEDTVITLDESVDTAEDDTTTVTNDTSDTVPPSVIYDSMTLKELQALAKSRGITGAGSMKKGPIIEALKTSDRITVVKPGSMGTGSNSFLETSALVSNESE